MQDFWPFDFALSPYRHPAPAIGFGLRLDGVTSVRRMKDDTGSDQGRTGSSKDIRKRLAARIGADRFDLWFGKLVRFELANHRLQVSAPDQFTLDRLRKQFRSDISVVAHDVVEGEVSLDFHVVSNLKKKPEPSEPRSHSTTVDHQSSETIKLQSPKSPTRPNRRQTTRSRTIDTFVVGTGNRIAVTAAKSICERPGSVSPLFIYGPPGCGKSHLQETVCVTVRQSLGLRRVLSLSSEQFTSNFLAALQGSGLPSFRRKCRDVDLLAIDNVQFLPVSERRLSSCNTRWIRCFARAAS